MRQELLDQLYAKTFREIYAELYTDSLTGVLNRRAYEATNGAPTVAIIDVDSLKWTNDTYGHRSGDELICGVARALVGVFGHDSVYRLAGDEFAVKACTEIDVAALLEELRQSVPLFSYGVGPDLDAADHKLMTDKLRPGRAARGERPHVI